MEAVAALSTMGGDGGPRRFIVNLMGRADTEPEVRSCEINSNFFRNRTSFSHRTAIDDIFVADVARAIQDCLGKLTDKTGVVALPSFFLEVPGLFLANASVMASEAADGTINIILRFKFVMGGVNRAFLPDIGFNEFVDDQNAHLAASVLADISLPLLNFCTAAELGVLQREDRIENFIERLRERSDEIRFQIELVKRFVDHSTREMHLHDAQLAGQDPHRALS